MLAIKLLRLNWRRPIIPRKWLRSLYRSRILKSPEVDPLPFECDFFGMRYRGDVNNVIDFHCFFYGAFEKGQLFFWRDVAALLFANKGIFLDIGANVGQHALFMSPRSAAVHAFEPYAPVRSRIEEKIELNGLTNLIVHDVGVGDKEAWLPFYAPTGANLGIGSFVAGHKDHDLGKTKLRVVSGDAYISREIPGAVHMVKIDVEGYEKHTIAGLRNTFERHRPVVVFELGVDLDCSFASGREIADSFPPDYMFFVFDKWDSTGKKDKRKDSRFRKKGIYRLVPFDFDMFDEQADVIAFPCERLGTFSEAFADRFCSAPTDAKPDRTDKMNPAV